MMADVRVENQRGESQRTQQGRELEQRNERGTALGRRGERELWLNPFSLMRRLSDEMDRAFASSLGLPSWGRHTGEQESLWAPPVEVFERDNNLVVHAELPGINKDDVKVEVTDEGLAIRGERKREREEKREGYYRSERSYGHFYRMVPLPEGVDPEKAKAQFKDGVLQIEVPLPPSAQRKHREIPIKT
jgi:HSP20 family protein